MRYDRARNNLDRHPNYILAAYMASGWTEPLNRFNGCRSLPSGGQRGQRCLVRRLAGVAKS